VVRFILIAGVCRRYIFRSGHWRTANASDVAFFTFIVFFSVFGTLRDTCCLETRETADSERIAHAMASIQPAIGA